MQSILRCPVAHLALHNRPLTSINASRMGPHLLTRGLSSSSGAGLSRAKTRGRSRAAVLPVCNLGGIVAACVLGGLVAGCLLALLVVRTLRRQIDPLVIVRENAALREKVEDLQQILLTLQPMSRNDLKLRFTKGINRTVILGMVDQMLLNKDVNIWWLPDDIERLLYVNVITLMLGVMDEVVSSMSINFAGHNVKMQLTYLVAEEEAQKAAAALLAQSPLGLAALGLKPKQQDILKQVSVPA